MQPQLCWGWARACADPVLDWTLWSSLLSGGSELSFQALVIHFRCLIASLSKEASDTGELYGWVMEAITREFVVSPSYPCCRARNIRCQTKPVGHIESQSHRIVWVGRDLWKWSCPTPSVILNYIGLLRHSCNLSLRQFQRKESSPKRLKNNFLQY